MQNYPGGNELMGSNTDIDIVSVYRVYQHEQHGLHPGHI